MENFFLKKKAAFIAMNFFWFFCPPIYEHKVGDM